MFKLTTEIKNNLLRDLSSECHCFFQDDVLCCYYGVDPQNPPIEIDFSYLKNDITYSQLLSDIKEHLLNIANIMNGAYDYLCTLSFVDFMNTLSLCKSDRPDKYYPIEFNLLGNNCYLKSKLIYGDAFGTHEVAINVTPELLNAHNISVDDMYNLMLDSFTILNDLLR